MFQPGLITHKTNFSRVATVLERFIGTVLVHSFLLAWWYFCTASVCLEKRLFQPQNMLRICLHIEKEPIPASCSKPLLFMSIEANVAVWTFLISSLAKNIWRGLKHVYFHKNTFASWIVFILFSSLSLLPN